MTAAHAGHDDHAHHEHQLSSLREHRERILLVALVLNAAYLVAEVVGGIAFNSLALLADATHMLTDVAGLVIALLGQRLVSRPASARHSYGLLRADVLAAQANAVLLLGAGAWIFYEAVVRIGTPEHVDAGGMLVVAGLGLAVNVASAMILAGERKGSVNVRAAFWHMAVDAAGSAGAIAAGVVIILTGADVADPIASILIAALSFWSGWRLLAATTHILMEGTPPGIDPAKVEAAIAAETDVEAVHHLHIWTLASDTPALSAHVVLEEAGTLHEANEHRDALKTMLADRFGIRHATIEMECHACDDPDHY